MVATYFTTQQLCLAGWHVSVGTTTPSKDSLVCGSSRAEAAASNHCSENLPQPALNEVPGALEAVQLFSFILQGGCGWTVTSHEESNCRLLLEGSSASLRRLHVGEDPAPGWAGMQERGFPSPCAA